MDKQQINNLPKSAGIYMIRNMVTEEIHVGRTPKLRQRLLQLWSLYEAGVVGTQLLYDLLHSGPECFEFRVLDTQSDGIGFRYRKNLDTKYQQYLDKYKEDSYKVYDDSEKLDQMIEVASRHRELWTSSFLSDISDWVFYMNWDTGAEYIETDNEAMAKKLNVPVSEVQRSLEDPEYLINDRFTVIPFSVYKLNSTYE